jgi:hypothetical protein
MAGFRKQASRRVRATTIGRGLGIILKEQATMFYFRTRTLAREYAAKDDNYHVVDCRDNPNVNGLGWAVKVL